MPNIEVEERDRLSPVWDMSQERLLTEQLVGQRFNFFLIFLSVVLAGAVNAKVQTHMQIVLSTGALVAIVLTMALWRTSGRLNIILEILRQDATHPYTIVSDAIGGKSVRQVLWRYLPAAATLGLCIAAVSSWFDLLHVAKNCP